MCWLEAFVQTCNAIEFGLSSHIPILLPLPWASVHWLADPVLHWNATGWPSVYWDTTGWPSDYLQSTLEHHWKNLFETAPHWDANGETLTIAAYNGAPLERLKQSTDTHAHIFIQSSIHASLKLQDDGTPSSKWTGLCKVSFYLEFTALQCIPVLLFKRVST